MAPDSRPATYDHIAQVRGLLLGAVGDLLQRAHRHDASKLVEPEKAAFDRDTEKLRTLTYGTPEYEAAAEELGPALRHHYEANDHHPQHFENGIEGMNLLQVIEMLADWIAATRRHDNGDIRSSIEVSAKRFGISDDLKRLLHNTVDELLAAEVPATAAPPTGE